MDKKGVGGVAVLLFLSVFGAFFVMPVFQHQVAVQENTATTAATVGSTDVAIKTDDEGDESYRPVVEYEYTVEGATHTNNNVFPGGSTGGGVTGRGQKVSYLSTPLGVKLL